ncbi:MAG: hypothetical protein ACE5JU_19110 [Candidatus Binatia bacterium]
MIRISERANKHISQYSVLVIVAGFFAITSCGGIRDGKNDVTKAPRTKRFAIVVERDLSVILNTAIDLRSRKATYKYRFNNLKDRAVSLKFRRPKTIKKPFTLDIPTKGAKDLEYQEDITVTAISDKTRMTQIHPYLYLIGDKQEERILVSKYSLDVELQLPDGARLLKSIIPFKQEGPVILRWRGEGITAVPPIELWYTLAEEEVSISKEFVEDGDEITITIAVTNESQGTVNGLRLRTQFPKGIYRIFEDESDGEFRLLDNNTYRWLAGINVIDRGKSQSFTIVLKKVFSGGPVIDLEILAYNKDGDLIAIAPAER